MKQFQQQNKFLINQSSCKMENRLGSQKRYGVYSRLDILSRETRTYDLWKKHIKLNDLEQSWITYKINNSSKSKHEKIKEIKYFIISINNYIKNNSTINENETPYYSYYAEVNRYLSFIVDKLNLELEDFEGKNIIIENNLSDYEVVDIDENNLFIQNNDITILTKDNITYINFINLNFTQVVFIMYFIYFMEPLKYDNKTSHISKSSGAKNPHFNNIKLLNQFIKKHCLSEGEEFNNSSFNKFVERVRNDYTLLNPIENNKIRSYINEQPLNNNPYNDNIRFTNEKRFKVFIGNTKYHYPSELSFYLKSDNLIELLKLMNKTFKIV